MSGLGKRRALVEEDEALGRDAGGRLTPVLALLPDLGLVLFRAARSVFFFAREPETLQARPRVQGWTRTPTAPAWRRSWPTGTAPRSTSGGPRIVLATADGLGTAAIMRRTGMSKPCVWRWQERFMREGVAGLLRDKTRKPGTPPLPAATVEPGGRADAAPSRRARRPTGPAA